jgi:DNA-dependent RNA polymerase auxiliary subunit epsilon
MFFSATKLAVPANSDLLVTGPLHAKRNTRRRLMLKIGTFFIEFIFFVSNNQPEYSKDGVDHKH